MSNFVGSNLDIWRYLLNKIRTYFEQNPDADFWLSPVGRQSRPAFPKSRLAGGPPKPAKIFIFIRAGDKNFSIKKDLIFAGFSKFASQISFGNASHPNFFQK